MLIKFSIRIFSFFMIIILLMGGFNATPVAPAQAQGSTGEESQMADVLVRIYYGSRDELNQLAGSVDVWEVNPDEGYLLAEMTQAEAEWHISQGYNIQIDWERTQRMLGILSVNGIGDFPCYEPLDDTFAIAQGLADSYEGLVEYVDIGDSYHKQNISDPEPGYDMMILVLTNEAITGDKPDLFINGGIHAREYATPELVLRFAQWLLNNYGTDADATWLLDFTEIHLLIQTNPDGRLWAEQTNYDGKRKNDHPFGSCSTESRGVDLNRNFSYKWGYDDWGSSPDICDETYRGPSAASEPETDSATDYMTAIFGDHRGPGDDDPADPNASGAYIDMHSYGGDVMWPWGYIDANAPDNTTMQTLGRKIAYFNGYDPYKSSGLYNTNGDTTDWVYGALGIPAYTFEVGDNFYQNCSTFESAIWPDNLQAMIYTAKATHRPYQEPAGPDSIELAVSSGIISPGDLLTLTARTNDTRYNNSNGTEPSQNISAAQYSIDLVQWWPTAETLPMNPLDGSWNSNNEIATVTIDTTGWETGRYTLFVRGQDASGNWGVPSAIFVTILDEASAATLAGSVMDACTLAPLDSTVSTNGFNTQTDPTDGTYSMMLIPGTYDVTAVSDGYAANTAEDLLLISGATTTQNFFLQPLNIAMSFDGESGLGGWTATSPWALSEEDYHSPTHALSDSPGGNYSNNRNVSVTSPIIDMTGKTGTTLTFWHKYATEATYDFCYVEYSTNGGSSWTTLATYDGTNSSWHQIELDASALDNQGNARLRFRFTSDVTITYDGWHIDDILLLSSSDECVPPEPPIAGFTFSPVDPMVGDTVVFTDTSTSDLPLTYHWDFGDNMGTSTLENPSYSYDLPGTFTVTLQVTNTAGSSSAAQPIVVHEDETYDVTSVELTLETPGAIFPGDSINISGLISPEFATTPIQYSVDFGDGSPVIVDETNFVSLDFTHIYTDAGVFTMTVKAWNNDMTPVDAPSDTLVVTILDEPIDITSVDLSILSPGDIFPGEVVEFQADLLPISATAPFFYSLEYNDGSTIVYSTTEEVNFQFTHVYTQAGTYPLVIKVWNNDTLPQDAVADAVDVVVSDGEPIDVAEVIITQVTPDELIPGQEVIFNIELLPVDTNLPVNYSIEINDGSEVIIAQTSELEFSFSHVFETPGSFNIVVKAWNNDMTPSEAVAGAIEVLITNYKLFLPLSVR